MEYLKYVTSLLYCGHAGYYYVQKMLKLYRKSIIRMGFENTKKSTRLFRIILTSVYRQKGEANIKPSLQMHICIGFSILSKYLR